MIKNPILHIHNSECLIETGISTSFEYINKMLTNFRQQFCSNVNPTTFNFGKKFISAVNNLTFLSLLYTTSNYFSIVRSFKLKENKICSFAFEFNCIILSFNGKLEIEKKIYLRSFK